jgi:shikimate dehydrogenase
MTRLFGVIGHPVGQSLSPAMHEAAFRALRLDARYTAVDVPPRFLRPMLRALILSGVEGLNVTVPLKESIVPLLDRLDASAARAGAANTVVVRQRRAIGYNTDGTGFIRALEELGWRRGPARAVVLGAGGAARSVVQALAACGGELAIANRHPARARRLAREARRRHPRCRIRVVPFSRLPLAGAELLVNATTVGMRASDGLLIDPSALRRGMLAYDLVYHRPTALVREARRRGCVAAGGLSMLLYQGAESLRLWLHRAPPIEVMRQALQQAVGARNHEITNNQIPITK